MNWYKTANSKLEKALIEKIKGKLSSNHIFTELMEDYQIPLSNLKTNLKIEFVDLDGKFAEGNGELIRLDKSLLRSDFFSESFHFVAHEFWHWVKRRSEAMHYFNDDEEIQSFILAISWELSTGTSPEDTARKIYPIVKGHYKNESDAMKMWNKMFQKASDIVNKKP